MKLTVSLVLFFAFIGCKPRETLSDQKTTDSAQNGLSIASNWKGVDSISFSEKDGILTRHVDPNDNWLNVESVNG